MFAINRWFVFLSMKLVSVSLALVLAACDSEKAGSPQERAGDVHHLRFGHDMPETSAQHLAALRFADLAAKYSEGKISISIFPGQSLGSDHEMIAMTQQGQLDIMLPPSAKLSTILPAMQLPDIPFLFSSHEEVDRVLDGPAGRKLLSRLEEVDLIGAAFWESGFKQFTSRVQLDSKEAFRQTRFRIMRSAVIKEQFQAWGAETRFIDFNSTYKALADGVVDGQENPIVTIYSMKFHELQDHLTLSNHGYLSQVLVFSKKVFDGLPGNLQQALLRAAAEATVYERREARKLEQEFLHKVKQTSIVVKELDPECRQLLEPARAKILEQYRFLIGTDLIEMVLQELQEDFVSTEGELVLALDADVAGSSALSGLAIKRGIELAIDEINAAGGLLGKRLVLLVRDNSMVSARGVDNLIRFAEIPNLIAVMGGISSPVILSELDVIHEKKLLFLDPWAAATGIVKNGRQPNYVFRVSVSDDMAAPFLVDKARKISPRIGLLLANNGWGRSNHVAIVSALEKRGMKPADVQWFDWGASRQQEKIDLLKASGAEVLIFVGNAVEGAKFIKTIAQDEQPLPVVSHWGIVGANFPALVGDELVKVDLRILQTFSFVGNKSDRSQRIAERYMKKYHIESVEDIPAPTGTAHAYDLVHLLAQAVRKANSVNMQKIRDTMEHLTEYHGLVRNYQRPFSARDHDALSAKDFILANYKNGVLVPMEDD